ncbi:MAG: hypothetical protein ABJO67_11225 [Pseudoruegeria sp.]
MKQITLALSLVALGLSAASAHAFTMNILPPSLSYPTDPPETTRDAPSIGDLVIAPAQDKATHQPKASR